jgi:hypothetical protein
MFVGLHFLLYALIQIIIALTSGIKKPLAKLFQWTLFLLIAVFAYLGTV